MIIPTIKKENEVAPSFSSQPHKGAFKMIFINRLYNFFRPDYFAKENEIKLRIRQRQDENAFLDKECQRLQDRIKNFQLREDGLRAYLPEEADKSREVIQEAQKQLDELMNGQVRHG